MDLRIFINILQISSYFTDKLLGIVRDTILHMKGMSKTENDQSISPGLPQFADKTHKGDAALEFIKHVCAVLTLDQNVQHDVLVILFLLIQALYYVYSVCLAKIIFANLFYYLAYFWYYSWVLLYFLVLFTGSIILFQLTFTFIYSTFNKKFSVSAK